MRNKSIAAGGLAVGLGIFVAVGMIATSGQYVPGGGNVATTGLTSNKAPKASATNTLVDGWPTDDGSNWGVANKFTIVEASGAVKAFSQVEAQSSSGAAALVPETSTKSWAFYLQGNDLRLFEYTSTFLAGGGNDRFYWKAGGEADALGLLGIGGHVVTNGTARTSANLSGCGGTPAIATNSTDTAGTITEGTTATGCTLAFSTTYTNAAFCVCSGELTGATGPVLVGCHGTATSLVIENASASGDIVQYWCSAPTGST